MKRSLVAQSCFLIGLAAVGLARAQDAPVLFDMETLRFKVGEFGDDKGGKHPAGTIEQVDGKLGKAALFTFASGASGGFMTAPVAGAPTGIARPVSAFG